MILGSPDELPTYFADLIEEIERYGVTVLPPNDGNEIRLGQESDGSLVIDLEGRLPRSRRSKAVALVVFERWQETRPDEWTCVGYKYELRHEELSYRRALHRHDEAHFVRTYGVATHEHCEATLGVDLCGHYFGQPAADAFDAFRRLYDSWLMDEKPDCSALTCLG